MIDLTNKKKNDILYIRKNYTKYTEVGNMNTTQQVNFRADSDFYNLAKNEILQNGMNVSDVFNATLRKIATGAINPREFVQSDSVPDDVLKTAFSDLKREILVGHEAILSGNTTKLSDVRKEFNLD